MSLLQNYDFENEELDEWRKFNLDSVISVEGMKDFSEFARPRAQHQAGKLTGLSFMLVFEDSFEESACPIVDSHGYLVKTC